MKVLMGGLVWQLIWVGPKVHGYGILGINWGSSASVSKTIYRDMDEWIRARGKVVRDTAAGGRQGRLRRAHPNTTRPYTNGQAQLCIIFVAAVSASAEISTPLFSNHISVSQYFLHVLLNIHETRSIINGREITG